MIRGATGRPVVPVSPFDEAADSPSTIRTRTGELWLFEERDMPLSRTRVVIAGDRGRLLTKPSRWDRELERGLRSEDEGERERSLRCSRERPRGGVGDL